MAVTLRDVARQADVSLKTVSNVVNERPHVREETRARVMDAIQRLGYRPNLSARQLKYGRSGFITLAVSELRNPYFAELATRITAEAARLGYIALLEITEGDREHERLILNGAQTHMVDGVIFSPTMSSVADIAARQDTVPMVLLGEREAPPGFDRVAVDSVAASDAMVTHLIATGHRRVAALGALPEIGTASVRLAGYRQAMAHAGLPVDPALIIDVPSYTRANGRDAMLRLLTQPDRPDAVFCFSDLLALGAIRACQESGVDVPRDVAIAGFDDLDETRFYTPSLTTITPDMDFLARRALRVLDDRIRGRVEPGEGGLVDVPWRLTVRESTGGPHVRPSSRSGSSTHPAGS